MATGIDVSRAGNGQGPRTSSGTLPDKVAQLYYALGLFCSTYPTTIITLAIAVVLFCCYPLVNLPLPGNLPLQVTGPNVSQTVTDEPWCYVQQIVLRTAVVPWGSGLVLADAFRAPMYEVFKLLEVVRNYQQDTKTFSHLCLHVEAVKRNDYQKENESFLPEYSCLILSPANFWQQNVQQFNQDTHLLTTIFNHQNIQKGKISLAEILFGMNMKDTGIKRYPLRNRQRILQYAITLVFKQYDEPFISGLKEKLASIYPLHQSNNSATTNTTNATTDNHHHNNNNNNILYIYYPGVFNYIEFVPLAVTFLILFFYIYFSVRKIEVIKSKIGIAFAAVITVLGSLSMSVGLCFFFGLTLSMQGKEIFPYLVILVGLENVLVLTKSVVSTPQHLDVKIRVAQGLSKEGWSITKNILVEITILTIGLATFVPMIQEFCIFAITGLISDFFLQMFFFSTILGIDIHRMEITAEKTHTSFRNSLYQTHNLYDKVSGFVPRTAPGPSAGGGLNRSKSHPRLSTNVIAAQSGAVQEKKIPKRLRLVNIWARTRFFQRAFMIWMVVWISIIVYNSGVIEHFFEVDGPSKENASRNFNRNCTMNKSLSSSAVDYTKHNNTIDDQNKQHGHSNNNNNNKNYVTQKTFESPPADIFAANTTDDLVRLKHSEFGYRHRLSTQHWPRIFDKYNMSLSGSYIALLPNIRISHAVSPEQAVLLRNGNEKYAQPFQWHALAAALDPLDFTEVESKHPTGGAHHVDQPFYPNSPMEILLATILCVISVVVLAYMMVVLYRCVCTRNYAEWRASWSNERADEPVAQLVMEAVPMVLDGHCQEIECLVTDGSSVVSSCLGGQLKIWDATTGEQLSSIDRKLYFGAIEKSTDLSVEFDDSLLSDYESGSPPSRDENTMSFPSLQKKINTSFRETKLLLASDGVRNRSFDFGDHYRQLYLSHDQNEKARTLESDSTQTQRWLVNQASTNLARKRLKTTSESISVVGGTDGKVPPIWCIDYVDNLIVLGCSSGRLEFWEGTTGKLKCIFEDGTGIGITSLKTVGSRVIVAKLNGSLDFLQLQSYNQGRQIDWGFTSAYRRTHVRSGSTGSIVDAREYPLHGGGIDSFEDLRCIRLNTTKAHQQPISAIDAEGGRVLSGSQDHTLKVFRLEDAQLLYTLHGHCGPITCLFIDRVSPMMSGSGSQDGLLCVWDLLTGACMYSIQAHDGSVTSLTYSASYVISLGSDEKLCVWERFQGHLLNTIHVSHTYASGVLMLTHNLVVSARQGSLVLLDVRTGETVRVVTLGHRDSCVFVKQMLLLRDAIVCDYGAQLRIVRFPLITNKFE